MNNYRVTFSKALDVSLWNKGRQAESSVNFRDLPAHYYGLVSTIRLVAAKMGIEHIWFFYEPYVEITWLSDQKAAEELWVYIERACENEGITDLKKYSPADGNFAEWFCNSEEEREFGAKRYALCAEWVALYNQYKTAVDNGKGLKRQVGRTMHALCNPLGLNYVDEAMMCFRRGLICLLFRYFSFKRAVWIYTKVFRQVY